MRPVKASSSGDLASLLRVPAHQVRKVAAAPRLVAGIEHAQQIIQHDQDNPSGEGELDGVDYSEAGPSVPPTPSDEVVILDEQEPIFGPDLPMPPPSAPSPALDGSSDVDPTGSDYTSLRKALADMFPDSFTSKTADDPWTFIHSVRHGPSNQLVRSACPWSMSLNRVFLKLQEKMKVDSAGDRPRAVFSPHFLTSKRRGYYKVADYPKLVTSPEHANVLQLVDGMKRVLATGGKCFWSPREMAAGVAAAHRALEICSFAGWIFTVAYMRLNELVNTEAV